MGLRLSRFVGLLTSRLGANGALPYDELPEDPKEKETYYRPKRSDKFKGPENSLFDIADHPWVGAGTEK